MWAIDQLFPIMPLHRLDEEPRESTTLADITCDSDGKFDRFIAQGEDTIPLFLTHMHCNAKIFPSRGILFLASAS